MREREIPFSFSFPDISRMGGKYAGTGNLVLIPFPGYFPHRQEICGNGKGNGKGKPFPAPFRERERESRFPFLHPGLDTPSCEYISPSAAMKTQLSITPKDRTRAKVVN